VTSQGDEFYLELDDFPRDLCNKFVQKNVLPLLGRVESASCTRRTIKDKLKNWLSKLGNEYVIVFDFVGDWILFCNALDIPTTRVNQQLLESNIINDPVFLLAKNQAYTPEWPQHHGLADARALKAGHKAWMANNDPRLKPTFSR
jgi:hypothetical protein